MATGGGVSNVQTGRWSAGNAGRVCMSAARGGAGGREKIILRGTRYGRHLCVARRTHGQHGELEVRALVAEPIGALQHLHQVRLLVTVAIDTHGKLAARHQQRSRRARRGPPRHGRRGQPFRSPVRIPARSAATRSRRSRSPAFVKAGTRPARSLPLHLARDAERDAQVTLDRGVRLLAGARHLDFRNQLQVVLRELLQLLLERALAVSLTEAPAYSAPARCRCAPPAPETAPASGAGCRVPRAPPYRMVSLVSSG